MDTNMDLAQGDNGAEQRSQPHASPGKINLTNGESVAVKDDQRSSAESLLNGYDCVVEQGKNASDICTNTLNGDNTSALVLQETKSVNEEHPVLSKEKLLQLKRNSILNITLIALIFFFSYVGFHALESLQSSINVEKGLGSTAIAIMCFFVAICCAFGNAFVQKFTPKWSIFIGSLGCLIFIVVNFKANFITLYLGSIVLGVACGPHYGGQAVYFVYIYRQYSVATGIHLPDILARFSALLCFAYAIARPVALLISAVVLKNIMPSTTMHTMNSSSTPMDQSVINITTTHHMPVGTINGNIDTLMVFNMHPNDSMQNALVNGTNLHFTSCGANHCQYEHADLLIIPDRSIITIMISCYTIITSIGLFLCLALPQIPGSTLHSSLKELQVIFKLFSINDLRLLITPTMSVGMIEAMLSSSFYPSFVSCTLGLGMLSFVIICEGLATSTTAIISGFITKAVPRAVQVSCSLVLNIVIGIIWLTWNPHSKDLWVFFLLPLLQGATLGILKTHIYALYSQHFKESTGAAISLQWGFLWITKGTVFAYAPYVCYAVKTYIYLGLLILALFSYITLEVRLRHRSSKV